MNPLNHRIQIFFMFANFYSIFHNIKYNKKAVSFQIRLISEPDQLLGLKGQDVKGKIRKNLFNCTAPTKNQLFENVVSFENFKGFRNI